MGIMSGGRILKLSSSGQDTDIPEGVTGQFLVSLVGEMHNPLSPP